MKTWPLLLIAILLVWNVDVSKAKDDDENDSAQRVTFVQKRNNLKRRGLFDEFIKNLEDIGKQVATTVLDQTKDIIEKADIGIGSNNTALKYVVDISKGIGTTIIDKTKDLLQKPETDNGKNETAEKNEPKESGEE